MDNVRTAWHDYYVFPRVVPAAEVTRITIVPRGIHAAPAVGETFRLMILPMEQTLEPYKQNDEYPSMMLSGTGGAFTFAWQFDGEQEHILRIDRYKDGKIQPKKRTELSVYSLLPDLMAMRPYRGDLHVHTTRSDGRESPEYVVAEYRRAGFDFMAITDHHTWQPSEEAIQAYKNIPTDIKLFHGEEVHAPGNHTHLVNFGGSYSINALFEADEAGYRAAVNALEANTGELAEGVDRFEYCANVWLLEQIRKAGGLAIYAHPHWIANVYHVRDAMTWQLFRDAPFDAFELLGGQTKRENNMQCAIYEEARAMGLRIPIVGSSDSHGTVNPVNFTEESTFVFAKDCELQSLIEAIKALRSVAIASYQRDEVPFVHGPYRMAKYAMFLLEAYFPQHDELCAIEGGLMHLAIEGDEGAKHLLAQFIGRAEAFMQRCFA